MDDLSIQPLNAWLEPREALQGASLMDHLFNRLDGMYPGRWRGMFPSEKSVQNWKAAWVEAFVEDGIRPEEIRGGIAACRRMYDWPPSVSEFEKACRPPPDIEHAFREAVEQMARREKDQDVWSHPAIFWAAQTIGAFDMRNATWAMIRGRWKSVFEAALAKGRWADVPKRFEALPPPGGLVVDPARVRRLSAGAMKASGGREWAAAVAERYESGKRVPGCAVKSAADILGRPLVRRGKGARPDYADRAAGDRSYEEMAVL